MAIKFRAAQHGVNNSSEVVVYENPPVKGRAGGPPGTNPYVKSFNRDAETVYVSVDNGHTVKLPADRLKLVQYVGKPGQPRQMFAEIRGNRKGWFTSAPHEVRYLGDVDDKTFSALKGEMKKLGVDWAWYPKVRGS